MESVRKNSKRSLDIAYQVTTQLVTCTRPKTIYHMAVLQFKMSTDKCCAYDARLASLSACEGERIAFSDVCR